MSKFLQLGEFELYQFNKGQWMVRQNGILYGYVDEPTEEACRQLVQSKNLYKIL